jgi:hypothetical protein
MRRLFLAGFVGCGLGAAGVLALGALGADAFAGPPREGWPPDPPAVSNTKHWVFEVPVKKGVPSLGKASPVTLKKAEPTPRMMGRFAIELYVGDELLDRLRFNVPLGGDGPSEEQPGRKRPTFKANTKLFLRVADNARATRVRLVDRATADIQLFFWPPDKDGRLRAASAADAGVDAAPDARSDAGADAGPDAPRYDPDAP